jgi:hypothetical protein
VNEQGEIPERLRGYFGHDKVAFFGGGGMPATPPAPPGTPARRAGETAVADGLSKAGTPGRRPGDLPAARPPRAGLAAAMRGRSERALMEASMRDLARGRGGPAPHPGSPWLWRSLFVPAYRALPWGLKRRMVSAASGVKGWRRS